MKEFHLGGLDTKRVRQTGAILATSAFLLGLILQPAMEQILDPVLGSPSRLMIATCIVMACALLAITNATIVSSRAARQDANEIRGLVKRQVQLNGIHGEFLNYRSIDAPDPYTFVARLYEQAETEILILDQRPPAGSERYGPSMTLTSPQRAHYYSRLTEAVTRRRADGHYLKYRRIIQLESGPTSEWDVPANDDDVFAAHCRSVIEMRSGSTQYSSSIKTSSVYLRNATITMIDMRFIIVELAINGPSGSLQVEGDLYLIDEGGELGLALRHLFDHIDSQAMLVTKVNQKSRKMRRLNTESI